MNNIRIVKFTSYTNFLANIKNQDGAKIITETIKKEFQNFRIQNIKTIHNLSNKPASLNHNSYIPSRKNGKLIPSLFLANNPTPFTKLTFTNKPNQKSILITNGTSGAISLSDLDNIISQFWNPHLRIELGDGDNNHRQNKQQITIFTIFNNNHGDFHLIFLLIKKQGGCRLANCIHEFTKTRIDHCTGSAIPITKKTLSTIPKLKNQLNEIYFYDNEYDKIN